MVMAPGGNLGPNSGAVKPPNLSSDGLSATVLSAGPQGYQFTIPPATSQTPIPGIFMYDPFTLLIRGNSGSVGITFGQAQLRLAASVLAWGPDFNNSTATLTGGSGAPSGSPPDGAYYLRSDTPGVANQRIYVRSGGAWVGIV